MKSINVYFEDEEYEKLLIQKGEKTWRIFILNLINKEEENEFR
jgi:predicted CopG family antitoxin